MKKIFALLILLLPPVAATAQSMLRVSLTDNTAITISVDDRYFNTRGTAINVNDIPGGWHHLKVFIHTERNNGDGYEQIVYEGRVRTYRGQITLMNIDPYSGRTVTSAEDIDTWRGRKVIDTPLQTNNTPPPLPYDQQRQPDVAPQSDSNIIPAPLPDGMPAASPVTPQAEPKPDGTKKKNSLSKLEAKVKALPTDTERLEAAEKGLSGKKLTSQNVVKALAWFNFESTRLEFAKWAFSKTTDPANFNKVVSQFQIAANKKELQTFIAKK